MHEIHFTANSVGSIFIHILFAAFKRCMFCVLYRPNSLISVTAFELVNNSNFSPILLKIGHTCLKFKQTYMTLTLIWANCLSHAVVMLLSFQDYVVQGLSDESCLNYLLPDKRDSSVTGRLRHANTYERLPARTNKFRNSFIPYCLEHFN